MATYTDWQQRQLDAEEPKREPAVPTQSFEDWLRDDFAEKVRNATEALIEDGWPEDEARERAQHMIKDGEL